MSDQPASDTSPGTLVVESKDSVTITLHAVTKEEGRRVLDDLANRRTTTLEDADGGLVMIEPFSVVVARWEPDQ